MVVKKLFDTLEAKHHPTTLADRLGEKSLNKNRPIQITMESDERKSEIMSKIWKLKNGPGRSRFKHARRKIRENGGWAKLKNEPERKMDMHGK